MSNIELQNKLLAKALYDIRLLLGHGLGSENSEDQCVREAAHLAYALHNEALAILENKNFDIESAISKIKAIDKIVSSSIGTDFVRDFKSQI